MPSIHALSSKLQSVSSQQKLDDEIHSILNTHTISHIQTYSYFNKDIPENMSPGELSSNFVYGDPHENLQQIESFEKRYQFSYKIERELDLHKFELIMTLGQGSFGRVLLVVFEQNKIEYALKVLDKSKIVKYSQIKHVQSEIRILNAIKHPNIIIMHSLFKDNSYIYVLMEYIGGGDLFGYINRLKFFQENVTSFFAAQIVLVLIYEMNTGNPPFKGQSDLVLFEAICRKKPPMRTGFTLNFKKIILDLLEKDPTKRLGSSSKGSAAVKEHPWFIKINFHAIYTQQIPSPFYQYVITRSIDDCRQESIVRNEEPLVVAEQDYYEEYFKDF
ncbi:unnamed protein product [Rotaria socialis]|uniref:Protein kinase domain-containing protein n=1 Tax=Rotaria socialis TaxID=392032 RepID=A0A820W183_9BILA|nr:unnamed protein product [Rotaria socialis]